MGISVQAWRATIGSFQHCSYGLKQHLQRLIHHGTPGFKTVRRSFGAIRFIVLAVLLIIGNVEVNPGPFQCHACYYQAASLPAHILHLRFHSNDKNFIFKCPHPLCTTSTRTIQGLELHVKDLHGNVQGAPSTSNDSVPDFSFACQAENCCHKFSAASDFCHHYLDHVKNGVAVMCPFVKQCGSSSVFRSRNHLASHLSVKHSGWKLNTFPPSVPSASTSANSRVSDNDNDYADSMDCGDALEAEEQEETQSHTLSFADLFSAHIGKFYLKLLADLVLPESTVQTISEDLQLFSELIQYQVKHSLEQVLTDPEIGLIPDKVIKVMNHVCLSDPFYAAHHKDCPGPTFTSKHFRDGYMTQNLSYVSPEAVSIDNDKIDGASVYLIRPSRTLKLLLEDKSVQKEVLESFGYESTPNIYSDYKDGKVYKNRPSCNEEKIDLIFASDACTVTSHVKGSAKNKYKINCSYFTLGNLKPHLRSKLDSIHLALLFRDDLLGDRVNYGVAKCFKPLLDDLKELEKTGIEFMGRTIKVAVQFFVCDSLGAHQLGGFIGNFTHTYFCRFCEITKQTFHLFPATVLPFRTAQEYLSALVELEERQKTKPDQVTHRGVKEFSPLNELREFHVVDPSLPPCLAHDLFEGVVDYDMTVIISKLVEAGWLSYESLNRLIKHFKCVGADAHNKPADAVCETKLSGHAVQNWTLVRLLPFILEGKIQDPQNEHWQLYLSLKKVVEYSRSPSFNDADLEAFKTVLDGYMAKRSELIEDAPKPKHHFLMHYPSLIPLVGPLIFLFTLRFEAKHQFLKRVAKACKNFINLLYTVSHRHQVYLSYLRTGVIYPEGIGPTKICNKSVNDFEDNVKKVLDGLGRLDKHYISLEREGIIFRTGSYMMIDKRRVGLIKVIASVGGQVYLIMEEYEPLLWEEYGVHRILPTGAMKAVKISSIACPAFQSVYDFKDELCFSSKFFIPPA